MDGPWTLVSSWTPWCSLPWLGILSRLLQHSRIQWYRIQWRVSTPRIQQTCRYIFVFGILAKPFLIEMALWPLPPLGPVVLRIVVDLRPSIFELHLEPGEFSLPDGNTLLLSIEVIINQENDLPSCFLEVPLQNHHWLDTLFTWQEPR